MVATHNKFYLGSVGSVVLGFLLCLPMTYKNVEWLFPEKLEMQKSLFSIGMGNSNLFTLNPYWGL